MKTGIYICLTETADSVNCDSVANYALNLPNVGSVKSLGVRPKIDPEAMAKEIRARELERIVIAGDSPGYFKPAFTRAMTLAGGNPDEVRLASFREHGLVEENPTERAKSIVACAVYGTPFSLAAVPASLPVNPATLIVGGGVAGIQAALEIADAGKKVYLVERTGTIGGHMAMFDKTFPTLDCAACILTPKMVAVGQHENIEMLTYCEVREIRGGPGAYRVKILKKARRVNEKACVACNICAEVCPVQVPSEFDCGISTRRAVYMPFPQAVPNVYLIDESSCMWVESGGKRCGVCAKKCPKECIDLNQKDETIEVEVGAIVLTTGYDVFDAARIERYGYGKLPNVLTSLEFERLTNASGPTGGRIVTKTKTVNKRTKAEEWVFYADGQPPKSVAIIHCVGSRDANFNPYCSRVCCMTALKYDHEIKSAIPNAYVSDVYIDMHAFGKGHEDFYRQSSEAKTLFLMYGKNEHPVIKRAQPKDGCEMLIEVNEQLSGETIEIPADMVILMVGMEARPGSDLTARLVNISQDKDGWYIESHPKLDPVATTTEGIFIAGTCSAPKDIPDTVAQARAAAARILGKIAKQKIEIDAVFAEVNEDFCSGCRMCNSLCPYSAVEFDAEKRRSRVNSALCKACGACVAACPSGAIKARHFTDEQILAQIEGVLT